MDALTPTPTQWRPTPLIVFSVVLHLAAIGWIFIEPAQWRLAATAIIVNHLLLTIIGLVPKSRSLGPNWTRLPPASASRNEVAITIDDGPDADVTPKVLDVLDRYGCRATFFCVGRKVLSNPDLAREMVARGHAIENHTANHRWHFSLLGLAGMQRELEAAQRAVTTTTGQSPLFFRAPAGLRNPLLEAALCRLGLQLASWTRRGFDTRARDPERVLSRLVSGLASGDILLVHDGNAARTTTREPVILVVLPRLLEAIRAAGLRPVTLRSVL